MRNQRDSGMRVNICSETMRATEIAPTIYRHHEGLRIKKGVSKGVVHKLSEPKRRAKCIPPPGLHWRCSSWFLWGWCADGGVRRNHENLSSKTKGPREQGAAGYCPKILLGQIGALPFHRSRRDICTRNRPVSETKFLLMISGGPFLSRPLWFTAENHEMREVVFAGRTHTH